LDLEERAKQRLDPASYDFIAGGAGAELVNVMRLSGVSSLAGIGREYVSLS